VNEFLKKTHYNILSKYPTLFLFSEKSPDRVRCYTEIANDMEPLLSTAFWTDHEYRKIFVTNANFTIWELAKVFPDSEIFIFSSQHHLTGFLPRQFNNWFNKIGQLRATLEDRREFDRIRFNMQAFVLSKKDMLLEECFPKWSDK